MSSYGEILTLFGLLGALISGFPGCPIFSLPYITLQLSVDNTFYLIEDIKKGNSLTFLYAMRQMDVVGECFQIFVVWGSIPAGYQIVSIVHIMESIMPIFLQENFFKVRNWCQILNCELK